MAIHLSAGRRLEQLTLVPPLKQGPAGGGLPIRGRWAGAPRSSLPGTRGAQTPQRGGLEQQGCGPPITADRAVFQATRVIRKSSSRSGVEILPDTWSRVKALRT